MKRCIEIGAALLLIFVIIGAGCIWVNGVADEDSGVKEDALYARAASIADGNTGRILWSKNGETKMAMASTTKIMTCLIALEHSKADDVVEISEYAASMPDVQLNAVAGDTFYMGDLLYALMLESHNDVAVAIAECISGSVEAFAALMNQKAKELKCEHTHFVTPNGLDADGHYTTANDLAVIAVEALKNDTFVKIINMDSYSFSSIKGRRNYSVNNKNTFLHLMNGAYGVKTGFTGEAGYCFVGAVNDRGKKLVSVVLGCGWPPNKSYKWKDTIKLMNFGLTNYKICSLDSSLTKIEPLPVVQGVKKYAEVKIDAFGQEFLIGNTEKIHTQIKIPESMNAPVEKGQVVGEVVYEINGFEIGNIPVRILSDVQKKTFIYCLKKVIYEWAFK